MKRQSAKKSRRPSKSHKLAVLISRDDPDAILTFVEWCVLNGISQRAGRRILAAPGGPVVTQLSTHRIGISRRANLKWQKSRERPPVRAEREQFEVEVRAAKETEAAE
jgi:hypothetical protein